MTNSRLHYLPQQTPAGAGNQQPLLKSSLFSLAHHPAPGLALRLEELSTVRAAAFAAPLPEFPALEVAWDLRMLKCSLESCSGAELEQR